MPQSALKPLKRVLHTAARIITLTRRFDHISPVLQALHWLPITQRVAYKVACIVYECLRGCAPSYISDQLQYCLSDRLFNERRLQVPMRDSNSFRSTGPAVWISNSQQ